MILVITVLLTLSACGKDSTITFTEDNTNSRTPSLTASDLTISADRDYGPSSWNNYNENAIATGDYEVPLEINVKSGNSGTGWLTLEINTRKFCYQGNATNNRTADGTKFILKKEKSDISTECFSGSDDIPYSQDITITSGDSIKLNVNGGGCNSVCSYTEAEATITVK